MFEKYAYVGRAGRGIMDVATSSKESIILEKISKTLFGKKMAMARSLPSVEYFGEAL